MRSAAVRSTKRTSDFPEARRESLTAQAQILAPSAPKKVAIVASDSPRDDAAPVETPPETLQFFVRGRRVTEADVIDAFRHGRRGSASIS
jgi:hypothetical protein